MPGRQPKALRRRRHSTNRRSEGKPRYAALAGDTEDIRSAVARAREAAEGKNVVLIGASIGRQRIEAGLVDEILVHLTPILLGDEVRFFASSDSGQVELQAISVTRAGQATNLRFQAEKPMQKITPFLWFDSNAEEAMKFYASVFKNSKIGSVSRYDEAGAQATGMPKGTVMPGTFEPRDSSSWR